MTQPPQHPAGDGRDDGWAGSPPDSGTQIRRVPVAEGPSQPRHPDPQTAPLAAAGRPGPAWRPAGHGEPPPYPPGTRSPWPSAPGPGGGPHGPGAPPYGPGVPQPIPAGGWAPEPPRRGSRSRAAGIGLLLGALVLGVLGGVGGAAAFELLATDDEVSAGQVDTSGVDPLEVVSVNAVAKRVLPAVVKITAIAADGSGAGSGSGSVISADGEILTNNHVIEAAVDGGTLTVSFSDGRPPADAEIVGRDPATDLALLQLTEEVEDLPVIALGDSDATEVGQAVVAVGSPYGLEATVTAGIVSALNRPVILPQQENPDAFTVYGAIQTDAPINPGNSGGALVNMAGQQIGVNSIIRTAGSADGGGQGDLGNIGIGYAIPINEALPIIEQIRAGEQPTHARLGVTGVDAEVSPGVTGGAEITSVVAGSPADEAGLQEGDVVTRVGDVQVGSFFGLLAAVYGYRPGEEAEITFVRDEEEQQVEVTFGSDADA